MTKMTEERKQYLAEYRKTHLKRFMMEMSPEMYEDVKKCAADKNKAVNTFIKWLLQKYIENVKSGKQISFGDPPIKEDFSGSPPHSQFPPISLNDEDTHPWRK